MCKTDKKTTNYIIPLPRTELSHRSWENWLCKNELIIDFRGQSATLYIQQKHFDIFGHWKKGTGYIVHLLKLLKISNFFVVHKSYSNSAIPAHY